MDTCILCKSSKKDDVQYGEFLKNEQFGVHTFCLYLSSNLSQNGEDDEGFLGFLVADIKQEVKRISLLKCCYCHKRYANIGCCKKQCRRTFHFICGLEHKAENQFCRDYRSFCHNHVHKVQQRPSSKETCLICYDNLCSPEQKFSSINMILAPCCRNGWFHKFCLQKFAKTSGYFFKCPLCNDANTFREMLPSRGIFIPNQDAAWELEPNAFAELLERPSECAAQVCKNKKGRKSSSDSNPFIMCSTCGSIAMHRQCLPDGGRQFYCGDCTVALEEGDSGRESPNLHGNHDDDEDKDIDICHVSDKEDLDIVNRFIGNTNRRVEEQNKRDSGTYQNADDDDEVETSESDVQIGHVKRSCNNKNKIIESSEEDSMNSNTESENKIKPIGHMQTRHLKSDSKISEVELPQVENIANVREIYNRDAALRLRSDTESSRETSEEEQIKPRCLTYASRLKTDSESSETNESKNSEEESIKRCRRRKVTTVLNCSDEDEEEKCLLSTEEEIMPLSRKRRSIVIITDSEDEEDEASPSKHKRLETKATKNEDDFGNDSKVSGESDEYDDPLENFSNIIEKQNKISCIALRTRTSQKFHKAHDINSQQQDLNTANIKEKENLRNKANLANNHRKFIENSKRSKFVPTNDKNSSKRETNLDVSCIAKRTRRKSVGCRRSYKPETDNLTKQKENPLNISCIAVRTRRKTICAQTNYSEESLYEMSQVFEKIHESDEEGEEESQQESDLNKVMVDTDLNCFIVDDSYEENDSKFDISCIANRTRKRKSLKAVGTSLQRIEEFEDCSSTASNSSSDTPIVSNVNLRRRCNQRITSNSSEEFTIPPASLSRIAYSRQNVTTKTFSSSLLLDNLPQHNYNAFLNTTKSSSSNSIHNYHPSNHYTPHSNNRKRV